jgi:hypothetical protein
MNREMFTTKKPVVITESALEITLRKERGITREEMKKQLNEYVPSTKFDDYLTSTAKSFNGIHATVTNIEGMIQIILGELSAMRKENREFRQEGAKT